MPPKKKMSLMQLTFIVAVNMMGSGIIMLPTNMAKVGAISLLSWIVTALGSMAIAYGFAQAGLFNQRTGGMAAYAEDAYGKDGYFITFYLYFLSLAIGNVAIGISAVGYLAAFIPWLSSTPTATCIGVVALLWLTTVANFGGPAITGRIGSVTVWGVILPVGLLSLFGWFWFSGATFAAAWNPQGLSLAGGMGSSIALTLWAFLGMESAAQNSDAVENPKRDVPLACMFGTLGAAVIYILSTTVIQGIVPNADLANSTGPFGLAFAHMFSPAVGSIVMALAVLACLGSLLGWQFTLSQTAKSAADERMFPSFFSKVNPMGAPIAGMIFMGIVQSVLALTTISPSLSEQFGVLVNLAVVTNVVPYIIALSALPLMMQRAGLEQARYRKNLAVAVVAILYSIYAIYASGKDAVLGGAIVWGIGYLIWGFIAPRFAPGKPAAAPKTGVPIATGAIALLAVVSLAAAAPVSAGTLDQIKAGARIRLGYRSDARPLSYRDESGNPAGYSVALCQRIAEATKSDLGLAELNVQWVPVTIENRFRALQQGEIDLLCGAETATLARRGEVAFSIPTFPGGIGALLRGDAPARLREVLSGRPAEFRPYWRGTVGQVLQAQTFSVVAGTTSEGWLAGRLKDFQISAKVAPVESYDGGVRSVLERSSNVLFGDRAILLDLARRSPSAKDLIVVDRFFTNEPLALALARGDEDFRLAVDRALSRLYRSGEIAGLYAKWCGEPDESALTFFRWNALSD
jgi:putrescine:ornithine antiporter